MIAARAAPGRSWPAPALAEMTATIEGPPARALFVLSLPLWNFVDTVMNYAV